MDSLKRPDKKRIVAPTLEAPGDQWMVLHTRARQEKAVARYCESVDAEHYLPLVDSVRFSRGRKTVSRVPLFPGYVFLCGQLTEAYDAVATKRVCQIIPVRDQDRFTIEIGHIRQALIEDASVELYSFAVVGRRCRITRGPFMGIEGVVTDRLGSARLVLQVSILGQGAALEIDIDLLEPVAETARVA